MKRFLALVAIIFVFILGLSRGIIQRSFESIFYDEYFSKVNNNLIEVKVNDKWTPFKIKGVNLGKFKPGDDTKNITEDDYLRWIKLIGDMNANVIRIDSLMPRSFYSALEKFNNNTNDKLYILQGIYIEQSVISDGNDINTKKFDEVVKNTIEKNIDYVHGNESKSNEKKEYYDIDVSKYVLGYTLGAEWLAENVIYYEIMNANTPYEGEYFSSKEGASSFEIYLSSLVDHLVKYESKKYNKQSLISIVGTSPYKLLLKNNFVDEMIDEEDRRVYKSYIDVENIQINKNLKTGLFVSYNMNPSYSDLLEYEDNKEGLLKELNDYHSIPVVISEYGVPSARTVGNFTTINNKTYISEEDQAILLKENYEIISNSDCAGSFISSFQDNWSSRTWNTDGYTINTSLNRWSDAQSYNASFGLLSFEVGEEDKRLYVDNSDSEWNSDDILTQNKNFSLSTKQDEKYLYLYIKSKKGLSLENKEMYINLDVTPNSGSLINTEYNLNFERYVDFLIKLNGKDDSRVLVHEYYNNKSFLDNKKNLLIRPDLLNVSPNVGKFSKIELNTSPKIYLEKERTFSTEINSEVGKLIYGNSNPSSNTYNSASDFYYGDDYVEVRIPWGLINFMDPSTNKIKDDYYNSFSIRPLEINELYVGLDIKNSQRSIERISPKLVNLKKWGTPSYHERLKPAYYTIKEVFSK